MKQFFKCVRGEMLKQHKNYFHSPIIYVSLFLWPLISFIATYYSFKPFNLNNSKIPYVNKDNIIIFLLLGYMCMSFFRSLVQSAWNFSFERVSGTLELIFLSPASRQGVILGNAIASLFESVFIMVVFSIIIFILKHQYFNINFVAALVVFFLMLVMAVLWGMFLNALFLFSRDSGFLFTVLEEPMEIFSGVKVPAALFPAWAKIISFIFPLTYVIEAVRKVFLDKSSLYEIRGFIFISLVIIIGMYVFTSVALQAAEKHARKTGNMTLF